ncbi:MAG: glucosyl-3-phosphoglycerate synthase [Actinomycetota bacterium]
MPPTLPDPELQRWFERRTFPRSARSTSQLADLKRAAGVSVSLCLPALNERATVGSICRSIRTDLMERTPVVDELVVVDSGSDDGTAEEAAAAGAVVHHVGDILPAVPKSAMGGKGETLWRSLAVLHGDVVVWMDSDTRNFTPRFVVDLLDPLLTDASIGFVKAFYDRPLQTGEHVLGTGGARVTELVARPMLQLFYPQLTGFVQPLSGECAARREWLLDVPFSTGYGVEIGLLLDLVEAHGLDALAQADLGVRVHRNQDVPALGRMAHQVLCAMLVRFDRLGRLKLTDEPSTTLTQFRPGEDGPESTTSELAITDRPPMGPLLA